MGGCSVRVFHLIKSLGRGGAEVLLPIGLTAADRRRFSYQYGYFLPWKNAMAPALLDQDAEVICFGARSNVAVLAAARRVARHLREQDIDLVHAHLPLAGVVGRMAGRMAGVPVVYTEHNLQERYHPVTRWLNRRTWGWQDEVIAVSDEVAESIRRRIGDRVPVHTVLNGVDTRAFDPARYDGRAVRERWEIPPTAPVVGTIAVFRTQKRLDHWLEVARSVAEAMPDTRFLVVGDGPERRTLAAQVQTLGLAESIRFVGLQEEVRPYLAAMDVYLMTSEFEGLPIALLEAMAMAVPPVVTAVGGIPEVIEPEENGALHRFGDVDSLAHDVCAMLRDNGRRAAIGATARRTVVARFSQDRMQRELEAAYVRVLERRGGGGP
jgi:glycosyltransferase involved in cell wall biosynthesis